jgi:hypothetical protein
MSERRRFPPPWSIYEQPEYFVVTDAAGQPLAYTTTLTTRCGTMLRGA